MIIYILFCSSLPLHVFTLMFPCMCAGIAVCVRVCAQIYQLSLKSEKCMEVHRFVRIECTCAFTTGEKGDKLRWGPVSYIAELLLLPYI